MNCPDALAEMHVAAATDAASPGLIVLSCGGAPPRRHMVIRNGRGAGCTRACLEIEQSAYSAIFF